MNGRAECVFNLQRHIPGNSKRSALFRATRSNIHTKLRGAPMKKFRERHEMFGNAADFGACPPGYGFFLRVASSMLESHASEMQPAFGPLRKNCGRCGCRIVCNITARKITTTTHTQPWRNTN